MKNETILIVLVLVFALFITGCETLQQQPLALASSNLDYLKGKCAGTSVQIIYSTSTQGCSSYCIDTSSGYCKVAYPNCNYQTSYVCPLTGSGGGSSGYSVCFANAESIIRHTSSGYLECCKSQVGSAGFSLTTLVSGNENWYWDNTYAYHWEVSCSESNAQKVDNSNCGSNPTNVKKAINGANFVCKNAIVTGGDLVSASCDLDSLAYCPFGCTNVDNGNGAVGSCNQNVQQGCSNPFGQKYDQICKNSDVYTCTGNSWDLSTACSSDSPCVAETNTYARCAQHVYYQMNGIDCTKTSQAPDLFNSNNIYDNYDDCMAAIPYYCYSDNMQNCVLRHGGCLAGELYIKGTIAADAQANCNHLAATNYAAKHPDQGNGNSNVDILSTILNYYLWIAIIFFIIFFTNKKTTFKKWNTFLTIFAVLAIWVMLFLTVGVLTIASIPGQIMSSITSLFS